MKTTLLFILLSSFTFAQDNVSTWLMLTFDGFKPKVFEVKDNSASELYSKGKKWANSFYPNIEKELIYDSLNYRFKIRSFKSEAFYYDLKRNLFDVDYTIIISFKDNKYRVQIELNQFYYNPRNVKYRAEGGAQETGWDQREFYLSEKELNPKTSLGHSELNFTMYQISTSLYKSMINETVSKKTVNDDDW